MENKVLTLVLLRDSEDRVLLGMKKRGFGIGKWNGFGGKLQADESIVQCACRETEEECGLKVKEEDLRQIGLLFFKFVDDPPVLEVHVFGGDVFAGEIVESDEMLPQWFDKDDIPFDQMWKDDRLWFPLMYEGKLFRGNFTFEGHEKILDYTLEVVDGF